MNRILLIVGVVVVLIVGFVVLRPSDDDDKSTDATVAPATTTTPATTTDTATTPTTTTAPKPKPKPQPPTIRVVNLKPVGGVRKIKLKKGDMLRFRVRSDKPENAHLHGYDIAKPIGPGKTATFSVRANLEGIFELELENSAVPIGEITVSP